MPIWARALMLRLRPLLVDEISEGQQPAVVEGIANVLNSERERHGTAMLVVEQNLDFALRIADRWAVLKLGAIDDAGSGGADMRPRIL